MVLDYRIDHCVAQRNINGNVAEFRAREIYGSEIAERQASSNIGLPERGCGEVGLANCI